MFHLKDRSVPIYATMYEAVVLTFLWFIITGVSHCSSNSEVHVLQIWVSAGEVRCVHRVIFIFANIYICTFFAFHINFVVLSCWFVYSKTNTICKKCAQNVKQFGTVSNKVFLFLFFPWCALQLYLMIQGVHSVQLLNQSYVCLYSPNPASTVTSLQRLSGQSASAVLTQRRSMDLHRPVSSANSNAPLTVRRRAGERYEPHTHTV